MSSLFLTTVLMTDANTNSAKRYDRLLKANGITKAANNDQAKKLHGAGGSDGESSLPLLFSWAES